MVARRCCPLLGNSFDQDWVRVTHQLLYLNFVLQKELPINFIESINFLNHFNQFKSIKNESCILC